jgi:thiol-disulfide isomerase/thioredoxin
MIKIVLFLSALIIIPMHVLTQAKVGDKAPQLTIDEWLKGDPVTSFENGKVYLVEFWGTWCGPCLENIPHLSKIEKQYSSKGFAVIGVATHELKSRDVLDKFMKDRGSEMEYRVAYDTDLSMEKDWDTGYSANVEFRLPICFLVNKSGNIVFVGHPSDKTLEDTIEKTLE